MQRPFLDVSARGYCAPPEPRLSAAMGHLPFRPSLRVAQKNSALARPAGCGHAATRQMEPHSRLRRRQATPSSQLDRCQSVGPVPSLTSTKQLQVPACKTRHSAAGPLRMACTCGRPDAAAAASNAAARISHAEAIGTAHRRAPAGRPHWWVPFRRCDWTAPDSSGARGSCASCARSRSILSTTDFLTGSRITICSVLTASCSFLTLG